jgi:hypothetical protein
MPKVFITYQQEALPAAKLPSLVEYVREAVAAALHCPDNEKAHLGPGDVSIQVFEAGQFDRLTHDVEVCVLAKDYPERSGNLAKRAERLKQQLGIRVNNPLLSLDVYIQLGPAAWAEQPAAKPR